MFGNLSYLGYTLLFCVPPFLLFWLRQEFFEILRKHILQISISTFLITTYGSIIWPIALEYGAWSYASDKIISYKLFNYVNIDDVVWWALVSLLFSSFIVLSRHYEDKGIDLVSQELKGLMASFRDALRGFQSITLERNSTVHIAVASFVVIEGFLFKITKTEWLFVTILVGAVIGFELMNSALERLASKYSKGHDPEIRLIKDTAAAGVLVATIAAAITGIVIFFSRFLAIFR